MLSKYILASALLVSSVVIAETDVKPLDSATVNTWKVGDTIQVYGKITAIEKKGTKMKITFDKDGSKTTMEYDSNTNIKTK
jgi:hypothetical protein